jgi:hypothetical protein
MHATLPLLDRLSFPPPPQEALETEAHLRDLLTASLEGNPIVTRDHCFAGQGSSYGALTPKD